VLRHQISIKPFEKSHRARERAPQSNQIELRSDSLNRSRTGENGLDRVFLG
jgi:hypothetical protein